MVKQAEAFENVDERRVYLDAASRFRLPYWDLIMPRNGPGRIDLNDPTTIWGCPKILKQEHIWVKYPNNNPDINKGFKQILNPLYSFYFPVEKEWKQHPERRKLKLPQE